LEKKVEEEEEKREEKKEEKEMKLQIRPSLGEKDDPASNDARA